MTAQLDHLVDRGLYLSRSEALREGARRLVLADYISVSEWLLRVAGVAAELIASNFPGEVKEVRLFGSVAAGEAGPDSDIDLIVIVDDTAAAAVEARIDDILLPISLGAEVLITPIIIGRRDFRRQINAGRSFARQVDSGGITLFKTGKGQNGFA